MVSESSASVTSLLKAMSCTCASASDSMESATRRRSAASFSGTSLLGASNLCARPSNPRIPSAGTFRGFRSYRGIDSPLTGRLRRGYKVRDVYVLTGRTTRAAAPRSTVSSRAPSSHASNSSMRKRHLREPGIGRCGISPSRVNSCTVRTEHRCRAATSDVMRNGVVAAMWHLPSM